MESTPVPTEDPRVRFAAERTLLAWVRTGIALMGFGFVVARFGLFLRELAAVSAQVVHPSGPSMVFGISLILLGVCVTAIAGWEYRAVLRRIDRGKPYRQPQVSLGLVMAAILAAMGIAIVVYLLTI